MNIGSPEYKKAFELYLRYGFTNGLDIKANEHPTSMYIWRTEGDNRVRPNHAAKNGRIFSWNEPAGFKHPGDEFNCRCTAEPYYQGKSEYAYQVITSLINDSSRRWIDDTFISHFYLGGGETVFLSQAGHLQGIINYYFYKLGKYNDVNDQIASEARKHSDGSFEYQFENSYSFGDYLFSFGNGVVRGKFSGNVTYIKDMMYIKGEVLYDYDDLFTDPISLRDRLTNGTSKPEASNPTWVAISDGLGSHYKILGSWRTEFHAEAKVNAADSQYTWPK